MENTLNNKRKKWIDILRALAILFVIYGHLLEKTEYSYVYYVFTSPIKIPLFFVISGYLFREDRRLKTFFNKLISGLIVPWLALSILPVLFLSFFKGIAYLNLNLSSILIGNSVWYMPCCIIAELLFYFLLRLIKNICIIILSVLIISYLGILLIHHDVLSLLMINRAISVQFFLLMGFLIRQKEEQLDNVRTIFLTIGLVFYIFLGLVSICVYPSKNLDVHRGIYYNPSISFTMIILGCNLLFALGKRFDFDNKVLIFIGQNTLVYYIWASYPLTVYNTLSSRLGFSIINNYFSALFKTLFVCCLCAVFSALINRFIPIMTGKNKRKEGN